MKLLDNISNVYLLGIGGIGMSALAQYFMLNNKQVAGYDKNESTITKDLEKKGLIVNFEDDTDQIPSIFQNAEQTLIVYTPAVPEDLRIFEFFKTHGFIVKKRAFVLGKITEEMPTLAVAGTHGKTTTSSILAHLLKQSGYKITAFLGGISENYQSNFICDGNEVCVVEADEYDRSFLELSPDFSIITSMDADHLDIYKNPQELIKSFKEFVGKLPSEDHLLFKKGLDLKGKTLGIEKQADFKVRNIQVEQGFWTFDLEYENKILSDFRLALPGRHNVSNAAMALALAIMFGAEPQKLKKALSSFKGVDRRFSYRFKSDDLIIIEDYAHHPEEIKAVYYAAKEMYADKKMMAVFQPHLYSRTQDFMDEFAESLSLFDQVILLPVYPARELPIPGIDSHTLLKKVKKENKKVVEKSELPEALLQMDPEVVLFMGAGDIGKEINPLLKVLRNEN